MIEQAVPNLHLSGLSNVAVDTFHMVPHCTLRSSSSGPAVQPRKRLGTNKRATDHRFGSASAVDFTRPDCSSVTASWWCADVVQSHHCVAR